MKVLVEDQTSGKEYPKLMQHINDKDLIVLFTEPGVGTVIMPGENYNLGSFGEDWTSEKYWIDFEGVIKLSN